MEQTDPQYAVFILSQQPSHESVACFKMPVPVLFSGLGKDTLIVFNNNKLEQYFSFSPSFMIQSITFDPDRWLVCKHKSLFTGINEESNDYFINVFPNPFKNFVKVKFRLPEKATWVLSDMSGKILKTEKLPAHKSESNIALPGLKQGMYTFIFQFGNQIVTRKLLCN